MVKRFLANVTLSLLIVLGFPLAVLADATTDPSAADPNATTGASAPASDPTASGTTGPAPVTNTQGGPPTAPGPTSPPGADSNTYTYNSATGLWENAYYTWDPVTHQTKPKAAPSYSYNPATGRWDTTEWVYSPAAGKYIPNVVSVASPPLNNNGTQAAANLTDGNLLNPTNNITNSQTTNGLFDLFYNASISNSITQMAATGDASVLGNTLAGNALSGNALDVTNILNLLQTTWNLQPAANLLTFTANINGNVTGDITIDPGAIATGPLSSNNSLNQSNTNLTLNNQGSGLINNDITLGALSGNASVSGNTTAGNATSGNATTIADVVNVLNSAITAGQSFLGVLNINGNLNGDILLPPNFIDQLIASGAPQATINTSQIQTNNLVADLRDTQTINNNVNLAANSGTATVDGNTSAGNATSGNATTNLTVFNLTGHQVSAANSLLVFVNVLGQWVGLIMDAPAGSTTAALCGGSCQSSNIVNNNVAVNSDTNNTINNNITANSQTGNADVTHNTTAGNATSGNATASANIMNMINDNFSATNWFGILFINVLGTWHGSFGVDTDAGNVVNDNLGGLLGGGAGPAGTNQGQLTLGKVFKFVPKADNQFSVVPVGQSQEGNSNNVILASSTHHNLPPADQALASSQPGSRGWILPVSAGLVVGLLIFGIEGLPELNDRVSLALLARKHRG